MNKKYWIIGGIFIFLIIAGSAFYFLFPEDTSDRLIIPYIAHQRPLVDPHLPSTNTLADKLDEVLFDGLFNISANASGITYENGLGELIDVDEQNYITIRLTPNKRWHDSYKVRQDGKKVIIEKGSDHFFLAKDILFTLNRIASLGSLSPDYILIAQALDTIAFEGPDDRGVIRFKFRSERIWKEPDIKEVLSFKILPSGSEMNAYEYTTGTGPYLAVLQQSGAAHYHTTFDATSAISNLIVSPFIDNSTFTTELRNNKINVLFDAPFGSVSPILQEPGKFFTKANASNVYFALFCNVQRLDRDQRRHLRALVNNKVLIERFFKIGTPQARQIVDYHGNQNDYYSNLNTSVFPSKSLYIEKEIVVPKSDSIVCNPAILPDTVRIQVCMNYGFKEELTEITDALNDPRLFNGKLKVTAVTNGDIALGNYDAVIIPVSGVRNNYLFDMYDLFLRKPDFEVHKINVAEGYDANGKRAMVPGPITAESNFFRMDTLSSESADMQEFITVVHLFMSTKEIGDKQMYARMIDEKERELALGIWLFSLPSLSYFSSQFDNATIDLYGWASQFSTIEKWREKQK